jgi:hypothetical protein
MREVSLLRLHLLRGMYLLLVVGLGIDLWPKIIDPPAGLEHMRGVVWSVLSAVAVLAILGLRYPLRLLPLLFFEIVWKLIWVLAIGLPLWTADRLDPATRDTLFSCLFGLVIVPLVIPWRYVLTTYVSEPGDRWRQSSDSARSPSGSVESVRSSAT